MNERKYFPINETTARAAHNMMSMRDYAEGSTTAGYKSYVDKAYDLADKIAEKRPDETERAYRLAERYSKKMAEYYNRESSIGMMCPSVMISGAGNFPVKKKERQVAAWDRNREFFEYVQKILGKIESILYGKEIIKSSDERAVEKLEEKLEDLKDTQERMKAANKAVRMKDVEAGNDLLREMGYSEENIKELRTPDYIGRIGYPPYLLTNNNQNIHRIEARLKQLKEVKEKGDFEQDYSELGFTLKENTEDMRIQLFFEGKPEPEIRDILKSHAFKWSPKNGCWQRQLTNNAKYATKRVVEQIRQQKGEKQ